MKTPIKNYIRSATLSEDGVYRYALCREWQGGAGKVAFCMLNPSTADASVDDPTIRKCVGFSRLWGYARLEVVNLFAYRATNPRDLQLARAKGVDVIGPENDRYLDAAVQGAGRVVLAWGNDGILYHRGIDVGERLRAHSPWCFKLTSNGQPTHPLYQKNEAQLVPVFPAEKVVAP